MQPLQSVAFPDESAPPSEKVKKPWLLKYAKAALNGYNSLPEGSIGWRSRDRYELHKAYAKGQQPVDQYKKILSPGQDPSNNYMVVDWKVWPIIPKFRRISLGLLDKEGDTYETRVDPIDALAKSDLQKKIYDMRAKLLARQILAESEDPGLMDSPELALEVGDPEDLDGLAAWETGLRHRTAMEAEQVVQLVNTQNDLPFIRRIYREDLFDTGFAVTKDYIDCDTVKVRRCDPRRMIISFCTYPDFSDWRHIGEMLEIPVSQLLVAAQGQLTEEDIKKIYEQMKSRSRMAGSAGWNFSGTWTDFWNTGKVQVLDLEIRTMDEIVKVESVDKRGNTHFGNASADPRKRRNQMESGNARTKKFENVLRIKWVVGTDIAYDYGRPEFVKRDPVNISRVKSSYHIVACNNYDMKADSRMSGLISFADNIQLAAFKLQHALNSAVPKGVSIDIGGLEDIPIGDGGEAMSPKAVLDLFFQRGILVYRRNGLGNVSQSKWVENLDNGIGSEVAAFQESLAINIELIRATLGLNDLTDSSTPNPKTLTTIAQLAAAGSNNALSDMFYADMRMTNLLAESVIIRAQNLLKAGKGETFLNSLGAGTVFILTNTPDIDQYSYGVSIEAKPTAEEKALFEQQLSTALGAGQITIADDIQIRSLQNQKQKSIVLAYKTKKNLELQQKQKQQDIELNSQAQIQAAQAAEQAKQQTLQLEHQMNMEFETHKSDLALRNKEVEMNYLLERERIGATGRVESSYVQAQERQESNVRTNSTTLIKEGRADDVGLINTAKELKSQVEPFTGVENKQLDVPQQFSFLGDDDPEMEGAEEMDLVEPEDDLEPAIPEDFDVEGFNALSQL